MAGVNKLVNLGEDLVVPEVIAQPVRGENDNISRDDFFLDKLGISARGGRAMRAELIRKVELDKYDQDRFSQTRWKGRWKTERGIANTDHSRCAAYLRFE